MTIVDRNAPEPAEKVRQIPTWAIVGGLVLALAIAGGVIWFFVWGSQPARRTITVDPAKTAPGPGDNRPMRMARATPPRPASGVSKIRDGEWLVRADGGSARVSQNGTSYTFVFHYPTGLSLTAEQAALAAGRYRILHDDAMSKEWGITPEQSEKIKKVDLNAVVMKIAPSDENSVRTLWSAYMKAADGQAKTDAEKKLLDGLNAAGKNSMEPTKAAFTQQLDQVKAALTADQLAKITKR